jgi:hypothetical protein
MLPLEPDKALANNHHHAAAVGIFDHFQPSAHNTSWWQLHTAPHAVHPDIDKD